MTVCQCTGIYIYILLANYWANMSQAPKTGAESQRSNKRLYIWQRLSSTFHWWSSHTVVHFNHYRPYVLTTLRHWLLVSTSSNNNIWNMFHLWFIPLYFISLPPSFCSISFSILVGLFSSTLVHRKSLPCSQVNSTDKAGQDRTERAGKQPVSQSVEVHFFSILDRVGWCGVV